MARKAIFAVFDTQNQAYDAAADIRKLGDEKVELKQAALVTKDSKGIVSVPETRGDDVPWGTLGGPVVGGLLGLIAGPAGAAAGAAGGLMMGSTGDLVRLGMNEDYLDVVSRELNPGDSALVGEIDEGSTEAVDAAVARHGGRVYRSNLWN